MKEKFVSIKIHEEIKNRASDMANDLGQYDYVFIEDALREYIIKMKPVAQKRKIKRMELNGSKES